MSELSENCVIIFTCHCWRNWNTNEWKDIFSVLIQASYQEKHGEALQILVLATTSTCNQCEILSHFCVLALEQYFLISLIHNIYVYFILWPTDFNKISMYNHRLGSIHGITIAYTWTKKNCFPFLSANQ